MKKSNIKLTIACAVSALAACQMANAALTVTSSVGGGALSGKTYVTFDDPLPSGLTVTTTTDGGLVTGTSSKNAPPYVSGNNSVNFNTANGADTTQYLTSGKLDAGGSITFNFASAQNYFGLLWGSVDTYNTLSFYDGATLIGSLTGADVLGLIPSPNTGASGTVYANILSDEGFNTVVATSTQYAFEIDNVAFGASYSAVPEPSTVVAGALLLLPFGVSTLRIMRKNKAQ